MPNDDEVIPEAARALLADMLDRQRKADAQIVTLEKSAKASADRADLAQASAIVARSMAGRVFVNGRAEAHFLKDMIAAHGGRVAEISQESVQAQLAGDYSTFVTGGVARSTAREKAPVVSMDLIRPGMSEQRHEARSGKDCVIAQRTTVSSLIRRAVALVLTLPAN